MQAIIRKDQCGEMSVEYFKILDKRNFRYKLLASILRDNTDITIIIDTNHKQRRIEDEEIEFCLKNAGLKYITKPIDQNPVNLLGFFIKSEKKKLRSLNRLYLIELSSTQFTRELFYSFLENYDLCIGFGKKRPLEDLAEYLRLDVGEALFDHSIFEKSIYDSVLCALLRSSFDISSHVQQADN